MSPERSLLYPDFRSAERAVYLLFRLQKLIAPGKSVALVTGHNRTISEELVGDVSILYARQLKERRRLSYPPYTDIVRLTFASSSLAGARKKAGIIRDKISKVLPPKATIRGPFQSFISTRRGNYEVHLLLSGALDELAQIYKKLPIDTVDVWPERIL